MTMTPELVAALRKPFPTESVGKLPRVSCSMCVKKNCDKHKPSKCGECGAWISTAHIHLDYVGHAEVTDRLLTVDPAWTWEPVAWTDEGLPRVSKGAGGETELWIKLTVCGVTRIGVGSVASGAWDTEKQLIGDAIRNAAMRFGVALDLWAKDDLESQIESAPDGVDADAGEVKPKATKKAKAEPTTEQQKANVAKAREKVLTPAQLEVRGLIDAIPSDDPVRWEITTAWKEMKLPALADLSDAEAASAKALVTGYTGSHATADVATLRKKFFAWMREAKIEDKKNGDDSVHHALIRYASDNAHSSANDLTPVLMERLRLVIDNIVKGELEVFLRTSGDFTVRKRTNKSGGGDAA